MNEAEALEQMRLRSLTNDQILDEHHALTAGLAAVYTELRRRVEMLDAVDARLQLLPPTKTTPTANGKGRRLQRSAT